MRRVILSDLYYISPSHLSSVFRVHFPIIIRHLSNSFNYFTNNHCIFISFYKIVKTNWIGRAI